MAKAFWNDKRGIPRTEFKWADLVRNNETRKLLVKALGVRVTAFGAIALLMFGGLVGNLTRDLTNLTHGKEFSMMDILVGAMLALLSLWVFVKQVDWEDWKETIDPPLKD